MEGVKLREKRKDKTKVKFWGEIPAPGTTFSPQLQNERGREGTTCPCMPCGF